MSDANLNQFNGDALSELSRTTTAYHEASIDRIEETRQEYLEALRNFNESQGKTERPSGVRFFTSAGM